jgi:dihydroflavonol-4-reductase
VKILVTGATGFLGTHLVERLVKEGHHVRALARSAPALRTAQGEKVVGGKVEYIAASLSNREAVRASLEGVEAIYHLAGLVSFKPEDGRKMYELHVDCTRELLKDVHALGTRPRFILASTSGAIAVSKTERIGTEEDPYPIEVVGRWPYYLSKIYEEKLCLESCRRYGIPLVVLNPSLLMGPGDDRLSSTWTVMKFLQRDIPAMPGGGMSFVDVRDVADAAVRALTRGDLYGRHLMGVNLTMDEFFARLERLTGVAAPRVKLPKQVNILGAFALERFNKARGAEVKLDPYEVEIGEHWFWCDSSKASLELGFKARDTYETLNDTVSYVLSRFPEGSKPGVRGELWDKRMSK